jgi:hypothetical protein
VLFLGLIVTVYYNFFTDDRPSSAANRPSTTRSATRRPETQTEAAKTSKGQEEAVITTPLDLASMSHKAMQTAPTGRNVFVYPPPPTPPPPPPTPPPIPPPITLMGLNPGGVIARTGNFTLTVPGAKIPPDAKTFINGREYPTTFVNESQVKVAVPASAIASPGSLRVEVRSASDPKLFSNALNLNVAAPPTPPYRYLGLIIKNGVYTAVLKSDTDEEPLSVQKGSVVGRHWRINNITEQVIEIIDTNINVSHQIRFTGESG